MTKDEALKMAIEQMQHLIKIYVPSPEWIGTAIQEDCYEAINACKEALEQPEGKEFFERGKEVARWADKQVQEPVAWIVGNHGHCTTKKDWAEKYSNHIKPLYTHPHQWQGLSDDEIDALEHNDFTCWGRDDLIVFARAIEQALKEKNT